MNGHQFAIEQQTAIGSSTTGHLIVNNGTLWSPSVGVGTFGTFGGNATIGGNLTNVGVVRPGHPTGALTINGMYKQNFGTFECNIAPGDYGRLIVNGNVELAGTLRVNLINNANPQSGEFALITTSGSTSGQFDAALLPYLGANRVMQLQYPGSNASGGVDGGGSGVTITVGVPGGNPEVGGSQSFVLEGEPTGVVEAGIDVLNPARDLALCVAALNPNDNGNILLLINDSGDGTSFDPIVLPVGKQPSGIVAAALADGPNADDIAVTNKGDNNVTIYFHEGGNVFAAPLNVNVGNAPSAITSGDLNADGLIDLAVTNQGSNTVTVLLNNGDRTFTALPPIPVGAGPVDIVAARLGGPGNVNLSFGEIAALDLAVANFDGNSVTILLNNGNGGFQSTTQPVGVKPVRVRPEEIDNPRDLSLLVSLSGSGSVAILKNHGGGVFAAPVNLPLDGAPGSLHSWDMDLDGDADVVVIVNHQDLGPIIQVLRNDSTPTQVAYTVMPPIGEGEQPRLVTGADVSGDGVSDLVAVNVVELPFRGDGVDGPSEKSSSLAIRRTLIGPEPTPCPADIAPPGGDGTVGVPDLLKVISSWGPCAGPPVPCVADIAPNGGDGSVGVPDLLRVISSWGACSN